MEKEDTERSVRVGSKEDQQRKELQGSKRKILGSYKWFKKYAN